MPPRKEDNCRKHAGDMERRLPVDNFAEGITHAQAVLVRLEIGIEVLRRTFRWVVMVLLVGAVVVVTMMALLHGKLKHALHAHSCSQSGEVNRSTDSPCLSCGELRSDSQRDVGVRLASFLHVTKDNRCCVDTPEQLLDLLGWFIQRRYKNETMKGSGRTDAHRGRTKMSSSIAAHLMGLPDQHLRTASRLVPIDGWIHDEDLAFTSQVTYRHGRIVVPVQGTYFVYSQVSLLKTFRLVKGMPSSQMELEYSTSLRHYVCRFNVLYPLDSEEKLMQTSVSQTWTSGDMFWEVSSYLGGVFRLRQGDELYVKLSNLSFLSSDPKSNYFGLLKVH